MNPVDVSGVQADRVASLRGRIAVLEEVVRHLGRPGHFTCAVQSHDQQVEDQAVVLEHEGRELETTDHTVRFRMGQICDRHISRSRPGK